MWKNKLVWITGASSGIGEALAHETAARGAKLILSSRNRERLSKLRDELPHPEKHIVLRLDLGDPEALQMTLKEHAELLSYVDVLFNNAGISQRALTWEASRDSQRAIMETNFFGATAVAGAVIPSMMQRNTGHIVILSSPAGKFGFPLRSSYAASKHALHGYFESLQGELKGRAPHITFALPGRVRTNMSVNAMTADGSAQNSMDERLGKGISPERCAQIIIRGTERKKHEIYMGKEQILIFLKRYIPALFRRVVRNVDPN